MNGPQHAHAAERLLSEASDSAATLMRKDPGGARMNAPVVANVIGLAQVHATLALVALLVDTHASRIQPRDLIAEWAEATR